MPCSLDSDVATALRLDQHGGYRSWPSSVGGICARYFLSCLELWHGKVNLDVGHALALQTFFRSYFHLSSGLPGSCTDGPEHLSYQIKPLVERRSMTVDDKE